MAFLDSTSASGLTTQAIVAVPAGVQADDIVIVAVMADPVRPVAGVPTGFTLLDDGTMTGEGSAFSIAWKRLTGADAGTYDWGTFGGTNTDWVAQAFAFRGRHTTNPPTHTENIVDSALGSPVTADATGLTALDGDDLLWVVMPDFAGGNAYLTTTAPSGYSKKEDEENANGWAAMAGATKENVSAGATGTVSGSFTHTGNSGYAAYLVRIPSGQAAITYKSAGTGHATNTSAANTAPTCPATVDAGDILIAHVAYGDNTTTFATPAGWTLLSDPAPLNNPQNGQAWIYGKIADGSEDGATVNFVPSASNTNRRLGRIYSYAGYVSGTIEEVVPKRSFSIFWGHATDPQGPTVRTSMTGALAVAHMGQTDDNALGAIAGATGGTWTESVAEYIDSTIGVGLVLTANHCTPTGDPGTVQGGAIVAADDPSWTLGFEIRPYPRQVILPDADITTTGWA